jgi:long-chain acyl-CoA synthetase
LVAAQLADRRDRVLLPLPLHHTYPLTVGVLGTLASGAALVLPAGLAGPQILNAIQATHTSIIIGVYCNAQWHREAKPSLRKNWREPCFMPIFIEISNIPSDQKCADRKKLLSAPTVFKR